MDGNSYLSEKKIASLGYFSMHSRRDTLPQFGIICSGKQKRLFTYNFGHNFHAVPIFVMGYIMPAFPNFPKKVPAKL